MTRPSLRYTGSVPNTWTLLHPTDDERKWFSSLEDTLALAFTPAAPPNTFRDVRRIEVEGKTYFLKCFHRTQTKNRWRNRISAPRCVFDAQREAAVAAALHSAGITTARAIAVACPGPASYYLCAELEGRTLRDGLISGDCDTDLLRASARFAGSIIKQGIALPDLSADHLWIAGSGQRPQFAVLDLHNGYFADVLTQKTARRMIRRFRKSVRDLPIPRLGAMCFVVCLLRAAGMDKQSRRRVVERTEPIDTHGRYDVPGKSSAYRDRNSRRTRVELELLRKVWPGNPGDIVLDSPCGAGRLGSTLAELTRCLPFGSDRSFAMLKQAKAAHGHRALLQADATAAPLGDRSVDGCVVFRFLHHVDDKVARQVVEAAARVADRYVVITFFHPMSLHNIERRLREKLSGRTRTRYTVTLGRLSRWFNDAGFELQQHAGEQPYLRDFWIASFRRR